MIIGVVGPKCAFKSVNRYYHSDQCIRITKKSDLKNHQFDKLFLNYYFTTGDIKLQYDNLMRSCKHRMKYKS